jgi:hypothetical protein
LLAAGPPGAPFANQATEVFDFTLTMPDVHRCGCELVSCLPV